MVSYYFQYQLYEDVHLLISIHNCMYICYVWNSCTLPWCNCHWRPGSAAKLPTPSITPVCLNCGGHSAFFHYFPLFTRPEMLRSMQWYKRAAAFLHRVAVTNYYVSFCCSTLSFTLRSLLHLHFLHFLPDRYLLQRQSACQYNVRHCFSAAGKW